MGVISSYNPEEICVIVTTEYMRSSDKHAFGDSTLRSESLPVTGHTSVHTDRR